MSFAAWMALGGTLLLAMALSSAWIQRLPISTAAIYLGAGVAMGPWGFGLIHIDLTDDSHWLERFTEVAVILSLFIGGLRLRLPLKDPAWRAAHRLASLVMLVSIAGVAVVAWQVFHIQPVMALLIGAILAPTDPVLAGSVTVGHSQDHDRLRYALSGEAGLNDGAAFPFVALGLMLLGGPPSIANFADWAARDILWAVPAGLLLGFALGHLVGRAAIVLRSRNRDTAAPTDFLTLALIALAYTAANAIGAWGFLSVFAAGIGLRRAELTTVENDPHPKAKAKAKTDTEEVHPPAETLVSPNTVTEREMSEPAVAAGVLVAEVFSFGDTVERLLEVILVVLVGVALASHWDLRGAVLGLVLILFIRPPATFLCLLGTPISTLQRGLIGWFGIRGIGSLYYLAYALTHGVTNSAGRELADVVLSAVAVSIIVHGLTAQPLMIWYERKHR